MWKLHFKEASLYLLTEDQFENMWKIMRVSQLSQVWKTQLAVRMNPNIEISLWKSAYQVFVRRKFSTVKIPHCEISIQRKFRTPEIPYDKIYVQQNFRAANIPYGENLLGRKILRRKLLRQKILRQNILAPFEANMTRWDNFSLARQDNPESSVAYKVHLSSQCNILTTKTCR